MTAQAQAPGAPASIARYKRELRKAIRKKALAPEINFLNITAMLDMMTIILVFLLKSLSNATGNTPQTQDLELPKSFLASQLEKEPEGLPVIISKSAIIVGQTEIPVPTDAQLGVEQRFKQGSRNELYIVPLANALQSLREQDELIRQRQGKDPSFSEAIVIVDGTIPYRVLTEVLFTLGQTKFTKFHMLVMQAQ